MAKKRKTILDWASYYHRFGWCVIPVPYGKKAPEIRWKKYQNKRPNKDQLARWFKDEKHQNIAAVLGQVSGGLVCRDFDTRTGYQMWVEGHPGLAKILPTVRTPHGYHVYFQGEVKHVRYFKDGEGELRGEHCYCILPPSTGEDGQGYKWVIPPTKENLIWFEPEQIESMFCSQVQTHGTEKTEENGGKLRRGKIKQLKLNEKVKDAIRKTLPTEFRTRHRRIFELARELKSIPAYTDADPRQFRSVVKEWHRAALPKIRTKPFEETWIDFLIGWQKIKYRIGEGPMSLIVAKAKKINPPRIALRYYSGHPKLQFLVTLCRELQTASGREPFFLSARTAAKHLGVSAMTAWRWLYLLVQDDILKVARRGGTAQNPRKATRYQYIRPLMDL